MSGTMDTRLLQDTITKLRDQYLGLEMVLRLHEDDIPEIHANLSCWSKEQVISCWWDLRSEISSRSAYQVPSSDQLPASWSCFHQPTFPQQPRGPRPHCSYFPRYPSGTSSSPRSFNRQSGDSRFSGLSSRTSVTSINSIPESHAIPSLEPQPALPQCSDPHPTRPQHQLPFDDSSEDYGEIFNDYIIPSVSGDVFEPSGATQQPYPEHTQPGMIYSQPQAMPWTEQSNPRNFTYPAVPTAPPRGRMKPVGVYQNAAQLHSYFTQSPTPMSPPTAAARSSARTSGTPAKPKRTIWCPYRGCGQEFTRPADFEQHVLGAHERSDSYICVHDDIRYNRISDLRSHHSKQHEKKDQPDCNVENTNVCERHEQLPRKSNWGCRLCTKLSFDAEEWLTHHKYHVLTEKKEKADCDFSTLIHSLLTQKSIALRWKIRMKVLHPNPSKIRYEWNAETSNELLRALEWGDFRGKQLSQPEDVEQLVDHAVATGIAVVVKKRPASSSPSALHTLPVGPRSSAIPPVDLSGVPCYDNGNEQQHPHPQSQSQSQRLVHR